MDHSHALSLTKSRMTASLTERNMRLNQGRAGEHFACNTRASQFIAINYRCNVYPDSPSQGPCRSQDLFARGKFPDAGQSLRGAFDIRPTDNAVLVNQELTLELRPLSLLVDLVRVVLSITVKLCRGRS